MRARQLLLALLSLCWLAPAAPAASGPADQWDGKRALGDIERQLSFGVRSPEEPGHQPTIQWIVGEFKKLGIEATLQSWDYTAPDGRKLRLTNIVGRYLPDLKDRVLVGTHYDSIIRAYRDPKTPDAPMPGANNSASGVALLLETARALVAGMPLSRGVDFVFFDGEEGPLSLGAGDPNWQALGSPYFVQHIRAFYPADPPQWAAIFDMVCWRELKLYPETSSLVFAKPEVTKFWNIGWDIDPRVFKLGKTVGPISDDHTALGTAGIHAFLTIDFDYDPWFNTTQDTLDKCSADKLAVVGKTLVRFLYSD
jgi:peptidase M28-like protein